MQKTGETLRGTEESNKLRFFENRVVTLAPHEKYHIFRHAGHRVLLGAFDRWPWPSWTPLAQTSCYRNENTPRVQGGLARVSPKNGVERSFGNSTWIWRLKKNSCDSKPVGKLQKLYFGILVGGLEPSNFIVPFIWECHLSNWRYSYFSEG